MGADRKEPRLSKKKERLFKRKVSQSGLKCLKVVYMDIQASVVYQGPSHAGNF